MQSGFCFYHNCMRTGAVLFFAALTFLQPVAKLIKDKSYGGFYGGEAGKSE